MTRQEKCALLREKMTLGRLFEISVSDPGAVNALWLEGDEVRSADCGELQRRAFACAERVTELALGQPGDFVGIAVDTCREWPQLFWGLLAANRQVILIDPSLADAAILHLLKQAGATHLITRKDRGLPAFIVQTQPDILLLNAKPSATFTPDWADCVALCTSGTTATSRVYLFDGKSVCAQIVSLVAAQADHYATRESNGPMRTLCFLPLNHIFGFIGNVIWLFFLGYPQVFLQDRSAETILKTCRTAGVQIVLAVPLLANSLSATLKKRIAKEKRTKRALVSLLTALSLGIQYINPDKGATIARRLFRSINENLFGDTLELMVLGGSHAPKEHLKRINALGYTTALGFGMTEVGVTSVEVAPSMKSRLTGSVGQPLSLSEYKVKPNGKDPQTGELFIRTDAIHIGRMEEGRLVAADTDAEGWYATGDIVRIGKKGRMYVKGRTKDVIIGESGENVYPDELEDYFADLPGVDQVCALGTRLGDSPYDTVTLVLCVGEHFTDEKHLESLAAIVAQRNSQLSPIRRAQRVLATGERLPVVNAIKVKRNALEALIESGDIPFRQLSAKGGQTVVEVKEKEAPKVQGLGEIRDEMRRIYANVLEMSPAQISDSAHFIDDLGGDSLQVLSIAMAAESAFSIEIDPDEYIRFVNVNESAELVKEKLSGEVRKPQAQERPPIAPITRFEDAPEFIAFQQRLQSSGTEHNPYFVPHDSVLSDTSIMEGRRVLNFGSYNYVGMSGRKETVEAAKAAIDQYGTSASGSRLLAGEKPLYQVLEKELAEWKHAESALVLVGGHSTNVTIVGNFCGKDDLILYDALSHNSIQEGCRLSEATAKAFPHNDVEALSQMLRQMRGQYAKVLIIIEGVYSMDGDIAPVPEIVQLKKKYGCFLLVDEAHSACVVGKTGGGVDELFSLASTDIDIKMGTLSKGLGACGGYLAGRRVLIDYFRYNLPGFVFSVGISPPLAAATLAAIRVLRENPSIVERLHQNIRAFLAEARARNLNTCLAQETAVIPVLVGRDEDAFLLSTRLSERGVFVPPAVYPAVPKNKARLRFCVISEHSEAQIKEALDALVQLSQELGIALPPPTPDRPEPIMAETGQPVGAYAH